MIPLGVDVAKAVLDGAQDHLKKSWDLFCAMALRLAAECSALWEAQLADCVATCREASVAAGPCRLRQGNPPDAKL